MRIQDEVVEKDIIEGSYSLVISDEGLYVLSKESKEVFQENAWILRVHLLVGFLYLQKGRLKVKENYAVDG